MFVESHPCGLYNSPWKDQRHIVDASRIPPTSCLAFHKCYRMPIVRLSLRAEGLRESLSDALLECGLTPYVVPVISS